MSWTAFYAKAFNRLRIEGGIDHICMFVHPLGEGETFGATRALQKHHILWM